MVCEAIRLRLDAELVRDYALSVSGLLVLDIGGTSVKPYQPDKYWENLNFPTRDYVPDRGPSQYRVDFIPGGSDLFCIRAYKPLTHQSRRVCRERTPVPTSTTGARSIERSDVCKSSSFDSLPNESISNQKVVIQKRELSWPFELPCSENHPRKSRLRFASCLTNSTSSTRNTQMPQKSFLRLVSLRSPHPTKVLAAWTHVARVLLNFARNNNAKLNQSPGHYRASIASSNAGPG